MSNVGRRTFLALLGAPAAAAALPQAFAEALAIPAHSRSGTINDVEHVVFLMQENRSFDHYFGTLPGRPRLRGPAPGDLAVGQERLAPAERLG